MLFMPTASMANSLLKKSLGAMLARERSDQQACSVVSRLIPVLHAHGGRGHGVQSLLGFGQKQLPCFDEIV
jgi:hypothetical protein